MPWCLMQSNQSLDYLQAGADPGIAAEREAVSSRSTKGVRVDAWIAPLPLRSQRMMLRITFLVFQLSLSLLSDYAHLSDCSNLSDRTHLSDCANLVTGVLPKSEYKTSIPKFRLILNTKEQRQHLYFPTLELYL